MNNVIQQPVQYGIPSNAPVRIGGLQAPYTLINSGTLGTIWLADNPGLQPGQGTPLHPGTSLVWNRPGDFWAVCDVGFTNTLIISDVSDWEPDPAAIAAAVLNSGVIVVDDPVLLFNGPVSASDPFPTLDVSRYSSVNVNIAVDVADPSNSNQIAISFQDSSTSQVLYQLPVLLDSDPTVDIWKGNLPVYGDRLNIFDVGGGGDFNVTVIGSYRPCYQARQQIAGGNPTIYNDHDLYWRLKAGGIPVGFAVETTLIPWYGEVEVSARWTAPAAAAAAFLLAVLQRDLSVPNTYSIFRYERGTIIDGTPPAAHTYALNFRLGINGQAVQFQTVNRYAAAGGSFSLRVTPITGGLI